MRLTRLLLLLIVFLLPVTLGVMQGAPAPRLEITGVNPSGLPTVIVNANVFDNVNQPITHLTAANFALVGELATAGQIIGVENIADQNLPIATVLVIDISTSMEGAPFFAAQAAARTFVQNIGENDPVAIIIFSSGVTRYQPYTTDKNVLLAAIDNLYYGGETALYQAAYEAVQLAAEAPVPRRAVILLSDGAEYGGNSSVGRGAALEAAITLGVPVYTIGLGYGTDRSYLQELSFGTNARAYESPTPEQLVGIYNELAAILRSQYVITLNLNLPPDGTTYTLGLQVTTDGGSSLADASLRTPVPVPIINLALPTEPITTPTTITAEIRADDAIQGVNFNVADTEIGALLDAEPYTFTLDPLQFAPGTYTLAVSALDATGDVGSASGTFTVAALPPTITLAPDPAALGALTQAQLIAVEVGGQTAPTEVSVSFDDQAPVLLEAPYQFAIDPAQFSPGDHRVTVTAANAGGQSASVSAAFTVGALPPAIAISGLSDGQTLDRPVDVTVTAQGQLPVSQIAVTVGGMLLEPSATGTYHVDPMLFPPGGTTVSVTATLENGQSATANLNVLVAALPPEIVVSGVTAGETLDASRDIEISARSQTQITRIAALIDGVEIGQFMSTPVPLTLDVLALGAGDHILSLVAENASGQSATLDVPFGVSMTPIATATQAANATATSIQATQLIEATAAAVQATEFANATATVAQATSDAISTVSAQATLSIEATATQAAASTATEQANATATQLAVLQITQQIAVEQTTTQAAIDAQGTFIARSTIDAAATEFSQATSTQIAVETQGALATGTLEAGATATGAITATQAAQQTATQAANDAATATQIAQELATAQAVDAMATQSFGATVTHVANLTATQIAQDLAVTEVARQTATQAANDAATATQVAQDLAATEVARQTATQAANDAATEAAHASATAVASTATAQTAADARETARAQLNATIQVQTRSALETRSAQNRLDIQATQAARATRDALATATQSARDAEVTQVALDAAQTQTQQVLDDARATATAIMQQETLTQAAIQTQSAIQTDVAQEAIIAQAATATEIIADATETQAAAQTATALSSAATATQAAVIQNVTEAARAAGATQTGAAAATQRAEALATQDAATATAAQATADSGATTTAVAQATIEIRLSAVGPTPTPLTGDAQTAPTNTPSGPPTLTPTLVPLEAESTPVSSSIIPILIIALVVIIVVAVAILVLRRR